MVGAGIFISGGLPCPSEDLFMYFVSHCSTNLNLQFKTIKLYLCGIRRAYIEHGLGDPFILPGNLPMLQLQQVLRGIKKCQPQLCKPRLPITYEILSQFVAIMDRGFSGKYLDALMKSACCVGFFGFLRCGEFTSPTSKFDNSTGLTRLDILLSGEPDYFGRNKILSGYDLSHYQVPHCIRVFFYFVWFVFIHHNFQFYFKLCTYCNILDIYLS